MPGGNLVTWAAQSVRSVIFSIEFDNLRANELYVLGFKQQPSGFQSAPPGTPFASSNATGHEKLGFATLQMTPGRIDLSIVPSQSQNRKPGTVPELVDLGGSLDLIQQASTAVCAKVTKVSRLAFILDLVKSVTSQADANALLSEVAPQPIDPESIFDYLLQYTKKYELRSFADIKINIVYRWAATQVQQFVLPSGFGISSIPTAPTSFYIATVTLDVNTIPEITEIEAARADAIFRELREKIDVVRRGGPIG